MFAVAKIHVFVLHNRSSILIQNVLLAKFAESSMLVDHHVCSLIQCILIPQWLSRISVSADQSFIDIRGNN